MSNKDSVKDMISSILEVEISRLFNMSLSSFDGLPMAEISRLEALVTVKKIMDRFTNEEDPKFDVKNVSNVDIAALIKAAGESEHE